MRNHYFSIIPDLFILVNAKYFSQRVESFFLASKENPFHFFLGRVNRIAIDDIFVLCQNIFWIMQNVNDLLLELNGSLFFPNTIAKDIPGILYH